MLDEHGMPVPVCEKVIVEQFGDEYHLLVDGEAGFQVVLTFCKTRDAAEFFAQAVNFIAACREIVRRLAEWDKKYPKGTIHGFNAEKEHDAIATDAAKLWAKMQEEAKGGDDNVG